MSTQYRRPHIPRERTRRRVSSPDQSPIQHSRQSWEDNGVHYKVETTTFEAPGITFGTFDGTASQRPTNQHSYDPYHSSYRHASIDSPRGEFSGAWIDDDPDSPAFSSPTDRPTIEIIDEPGERFYYDDDYDDDEEEDEDVEVEVEYVVRPVRRGPKKSNVFSRFKEKLHDGAQRRRRADSARSQARETHGNSREGESSPDQGVDGTSHSRPKRRSYFPSRRPDTRVIEAIQRDIDFHRHRIREFNREVDTVAHDPQARSDELQNILNQLATERQLLVAAQDDYARETGRQRMHSTARNSARYPQRARSSPVMQEQYEYIPPRDPIFGGGLFGGPFFGGHRRQSTYPVFEDHPGFHTRPNGNPVFEEAYDDFYDNDRFSFISVGSRNSGMFTMRGNSFFMPRKHEQRFYTSNIPRGFPRRSNSRSSHNSEPPLSARTHRPERTVQRPPPVLTFVEAQQLFQVYNNRWGVLAPSDPDVPYPCRTLQAQALVNRDTIWAPNISSHPNTWSEETIMQANVQVFFLTAKDIMPKYENGSSGQVEVGIGADGTTPEKLKELIDVLKKEKVRWHSDRLGRRNGGVGGANEALQNDARARSVFHAVCGLMEKAQAVRAA